MSPKSRVKPVIVSAELRQYLVARALGASHLVQSGHGFFAVVLPTAKERDKVRKAISKSFCIGEEVHAGDTYRLAL